MRGRIDSPTTRVIRTFAREERIEVERRRRSASLAGDELLPQRPKLRFAILEKSKRRANDVAGRSVATRRYLGVDEIAVMIIEAEGSVLTHTPDDTKSWYPMRLLAQ